ncbi:hypothetical protein [Geodermatophilus sp. CPCC 206100]
MKNVVVLAALAGAAALPAVRRTLAGWLARAGRGTNVRVVPEPARRR